MKQYLTLFLAAPLLAATVSITSCSKSSTATPTPAPTTAQLLAQGGKWAVIGATFGNATGNSVTFQPNDPYLQSLDPNDVVFNADGTGLQTDYSTHVTWTLSGSTLTVSYLSGVAGISPTVLIFNVVSITGSKMVLDITNLTILYGNVNYNKIEETLTH